MASRLARAIEPGSKSLTSPETCKLIVIMVACTWMTAWPAETGAKGGTAGEGGSSGDAGGEFFGGGKLIGIVGSGPGGEITATATGGGGGGEISATRTVGGGGGDEGGGGGC